MNRAAKVVAAAVSVLSIAGVIRVGGQQPVSPALQGAAESLLAGASGRWGVMAWSIDRNAPLVSINASAPLIPASNNKIFTAIWALDKLGPDYRFPTDLLIAGPIENGALRGDVILRGSGNPAF